MNSFIICSRKSRKKNARKADSQYYAWFRDPDTGAKIPSNRVSVDTLNYRLSGGGIRKHITSKTEAYRIAQEALDKGLVFNHPVGKTASAPRLTAYIEGFWDYDNSPYVKRKLVEGSGITRMQCNKLLGTFRNHCKLLIPDSLMISQFKVSLMERIKASMFDKGLSSSAINQAIECIRTPLNEAYRQEIIKENIGNRLKNVRRSDRERGILTPEEAIKLIRYLKSSTVSGQYERYKYLVPAIMYYSGMRNNEVTTLTPDCVEITIKGYCIIHVRHSFNRVDGVKGTKNGKERTTTIPIELAKEVLEYAKLNPDGFVFFSPIRTDKPLADALVRESFYSALESIGITEKQRRERNLTLYSLRHGFNTAMVNSGLSEVEIRTVTGHSNIAMTEHYNHETELHLNKQAEARNKVLPYII